MVEVIQVEDGKCWGPKAATVGRGVASAPPQLRTFVLSRGRTGCGCRPPLGTPPPPTATCQANTEFSTGPVPIQIYVPSPVATLDVKATLTGVSLSAVTSTEQVREMPVSLQHHPDPESGSTTRTIDRLPSERAHDGLC
jgi:hypothetical protein